MWAPEREDDRQREMSRLDIVRCASPKFIVLWWIEWRWKNQKEARCACEQTKVFSVTRIRINCNSFIRSTFWLRPEKRVPKLAIPGSEGISNRELPLESLLGRLINDDISFIGKFSSGSEVNMSFACDTYTVHHSHSPRISSSWAHDRSSLN